MKQARGLGVLYKEVGETDLDRRFARHLSHALHERTRHTARLPPIRFTPAFSTYLPQRRSDPSESHDLFYALARVDTTRPAAQVDVAAGRAAREVLQAQDAPASERRITPVAPPYTAHPEASRNTRMRTMRAIYCISPPISGLFHFFFPALLALSYPSFVLFLVLYKPIAPGDYISSWNKKC
jgi:hypothetical protein